MCIDATLGVRCSDAVWGHPTGTIIKKVGQLLVCRVIGKVPCTQNSTSAIIRLIKPYAKL